MEASIAPSAPPAPIIVWISSMNKITLPAAFTSSSTFLILSSNSPLYFEPATIDDKSSETILLSFNVDGTFPLYISCARPSTMADFPTPGSPTRQGLFFVLLLSICITLSISLSLPTMGSNLLSAAIFVKSLLYLSNVGVALLPSPDDEPLLPPSPSIVIISS